MRLLFHCWVIALPIHLTVINYKIFGNREEERDSRVFLKAFDEPASQLNPDRDKIFNFSKKIPANFEVKNRREFSPLGNLLQLENLWNCIMGKFFVSC